MKWIDVEPSDWFYRSVVEADRIYLDIDRKETLMGGMLYSHLDKSRVVDIFTSKEGQKKFESEGIEKYGGVHFVYVDGVKMEPSKVEDGIVHLPNPIAGGKEVIVYQSGKPQMKKESCYPDQEKCVKGECKHYPVRIWGCDGQYPSADLSRKGDYVFDLYYSLNEMAVSVGSKLKRKNVQVREDEDLGDALERVLGHEHNVFTIIDGVIYTSWNLKKFPVYVNYNYYDSEDGRVHNMQGERVIPDGACNLFSDRFFPYIEMTREEFVLELQKMRMNFYHRFTDKEYGKTVNSISKRKIEDKGDLHWDYGDSVLDMLDEQYLDGCYVIPLYEDDTFEPKTCITRAEVIVFLNRFVEWALERFR